MKNEIMGLMLEPKMKMEVLKKGKKGCKHYEIIQRQGKDEIGGCRLCGRTVRYYYEPQKALYKNYGTRTL